jgi:hypothetical protein
VAVDVDEEVDVESDGCEDDAQSPAVTEDVSQIERVGTDPTPVSGNGLIGIEA